MTSLNNINKDLAEVFVSIQGEGIFSGIPTLFFRFNKCNLKCKYCDTNFDKSLGNNIDLKKLIISYFNHYPIKQICFTGGEPLLFVDQIKKIIKFIALYINIRKPLSIKFETNGLINLNKFNTSFPFKIYFTITIKMNNKNKYDFNSYDLSSFIIDNILDFKFMIDPYKNFNKQLTNIYSFIKSRYIAKYIPFYLSPINRLNGTNDILETYRELIRQLYKNKNNLFFKLDNYRGNILQYHKLLGFQ